MVSCGENLGTSRTKIGRYKREHWRTIQARNEQVLAERFGDRLRDKRVWSVSSINLLKAAQTGDQDYEEVSRFHPLAAALHTFLFRAAGWGRATEAMLAAQASHQATATILSARRASLLDKSPGQPDQTQQLSERLGQFEKRWGEAGRQREELLESIREAAASARRVFWGALKPSCQIEVELQEKIDAINSLEQARQLATALSSQVLEAATEQWRKTTSRFRAECLKSLEPFVQATGFLSEPSEESLSGPVVRSGRGIDLGDDPAFKVIVAANEFVDSAALRCAN